MTKDEILARDDRKIRKIHVPEWGGDVHIRTMSGTELDAHDLAIYEADAKLVRAELVGRCLCDESGALLFTEEEFPKLAEKSGAALDRLYDAARELNGMNRASQEQAAKNSGGGPSAASGSL